MDKKYLANLSPEQKRVLVDKATQAPFTGRFLENKQPGHYMCAACGNELFNANTKFESGSGWPSFYDVAKEGAVILNPDNSQGMHRIEVSCARCGGHLGHVFDDAFDQPGGKRYCINDCALDFEPSSK